MNDTTEHSAQTCQSVTLPLQDTLYVINGKWKILILGALMQRAYRFRELSRDLGVSPRMLSKELAEMEMNHLVSRTVIESKPVGVVYAVTEYGKTLSPVLEAMAEWGRCHRKKISEN